MVPRKNKEIVCHCNLVTVGEIRGVITKKGAFSIDHVQKLCGAGTRCGRCIPIIDELLKQYGTHLNSPQLSFDFE